MRKLIATWLILTAAHAAMFFLTACCGGGGDALKGSWEGRSQDMGTTWTFDGKGGCKMENEFGIKDDGSYTIDGGNVSIKLSRWDDPILYQFRIDGDKLSLTTEEPLRPTYELTRK